MVVVDYIGKLQYWEYFSLHTKITVKNLGKKLHVVLASNVDALLFYSEITVLTTFSKSLRL